MLMCECSEEAYRVSVGGIIKVFLVLLLSA